MNDEAFVNQQPDRPAAEAAQGSALLTTQEQAAGPGAGQHAGQEASQIVYCARCGAVMNSADRFCHACGWETGTTEAPRIPPAVVNPSDRNRLTALLLCILLGWAGAHRFYVGKAGTGLLWLFTLGFLGIGVIYDLVFIATGEFRDDRERRVVRWE